VRDRSVPPIRFSHCFGLTASQLGVLRVPRDHPDRRRFATRWDGFTDFHIALATRAFLALDPARPEPVDRARRARVAAWAESRGLPWVPTDSDYVKSFRLDEPVPEPLRPLARDGLVRPCFRPPHVRGGRSPSRPRSS
jgi:hypothetical protein